MAGDKPVIWVKTEAKCFSRKDWTIQISLNCLGKLEKADPGERRRKGGLHLYPKSAGCQ
jgi:hypothetical protein